MSGVTEISASLVKQLRDQTGAGMMACKQALQETGGDLEAARTLLREKGMAAAGKRADRATTEGLVGVIVEPGVASIVGLGCETEPVSRNDAFQAFGEKVLRAVHADGPAAVESFDGERTELIAQLGENIVIAGAERFEGGTLAAYVHPPANKIGVVVQLEGGTEELARQVAMHISFAAPQYTSREDVPADVVAAERQIYLNSDEVSSKPEQARDKIVDGMLAKRFFAAAPGGVLLEQAWIHDASKTVARGARRGRREGPGVRTGVGRRLVSAPPEELAERAARGRAGRSRVPAGVAQALRREPDGRSRVRSRPGHRRVDRPRGASRCRMQGPRSPWSSAAATSTAA